MVALVVPHGLCSHRNQAMLLGLPTYWQATRKYRKKSIGINSKKVNRKGGRPEYETGVNSGSRVIY